MGRSTVDASLVAAALVLVGLALGATVARGPAARASLVAATLLAAGLVARRWHARTSRLDSAARLRRLLDTITDAVVIVDREGRVVHANARLESLLGYAPAEVVGSLVEQLVPEDVREGHPARRDGYWESPDARLLGRPGRDLRARHRDGRPVPVEIAVSPIEFGGRTCAVASIRDASARHEAESRYRSLFEDSDLPLLIGEAGEEPFVACNAAAARLLGLATTDEIRRLTPLALSAERQADGRPSVDAMREVLATVRRGAGLDVEWRLRRPDGTILDARLLLSLLRLDGRDRLLCVLRDVTPEKRVEEAARATLDRLSLTLEAARAGTWEWDLDTNRNEWPGETGRLFGLSPGVEPSYEAWRSSIHPGDRAGVEAAVQSAAREGTELRAEWRVDHPAGEERWLLSRGRPVRDARGRLVRYAGIVVDVTDQKKAERALRESQRTLRRAQAIGHLGSWTSDLAGRRFVASPEAARLLGREPGSLDVDDLAAAIHPDDLARWREDWTAAVEGSPFDNESRLLVDGRWRWLHAVAEIERDAAGRPVGMVGLTHDVTERKEADLTLREAEERFSRLFRMNPVPIALSRVEDGAFQDANLAYCELVGYEWHELVGRTSTELGIVADAGGRGAVLAPILAGRGVHAAELTLRRKDGALRAVSGHFVAIDLRGQRSVLSTVVDVTDRRRMESALAEAEERYRQIVESSSELIHVTDPATGRLLFVNAAWVRTLGYGPEEALGLSVFDLVPPALQPTLRSRFERLRRGEALRDVEIVLRAKDGREVPLEGSVTPRVADGRVVALQTVWRDVSDRRRREALRAARYEVARALTESSTQEQALPRLLRALGEGLGWDYADVHLVDRDDRALRPVAWWHDGSAEMRRFEELNREPIAAAADGVVERLLGQRGTQWIEDMTGVSTRADRGRECGLVGGVAVAFVSESRAVGALGLFTRRRRPPEPDVVALLNDVGAELGQFVARTQAQGELRDERNLLAVRVAERTAELRRLNSELEQANRMKNDFLASMSHELRTPLNAILGLAESMQEGVYGPLGDRQKESLDTIAESGRHLLTLINDVLDLAKVEAGKMELDLSTLRLEEIGDASVRIVRQMAVRKQIGIGLSVEPPDLAVAADPRRMKQVLVNLLSNAVKFTPKGGQVGVSARRAGGVVRVVVHDTGIGIAPEHLARLFQPFTQLDSRLAREHEGTGLGLALVRRLVELHGGSVSIESAPGEGTRVTVDLPAEPLAAEDSAPEAAPVAPPPARSGGGPAAALVLLAEDNEASAKTARDYLEAHGLRVVVARDGARAISLAREVRPDVILMDVQLPGVDGLEATRLIRAIPDIGAVPIAAVTALAMPGDRERCLAAGADAYLTKPVALRELRDVVVELVAGRRRAGAGETEGD